MRQCSFFILAGILMLTVVLFESHAFARIFKRKKMATSVLLISGMITLVSCAQTGPIPVEINKDNCAYCKMTITGANFAAQLLTPKGRHYLFDDISCMLDYQKENADARQSHFYVADYCAPQDFIPAEKALLLHSDSLRSPMGGNIAAFAIRDSKIRYQATYHGSELDWKSMVMRH